MSLYDRRPIWRYKKQFEDLVENAICSNLEHPRKRINRTTMYPGLETVAQNALLFDFQNECIVDCRM